MTTRVRGFGALQSWIVACSKRSTRRWQDWGTTRERRSSTSDVFVERVVHLAAQHCRLDIASASDAAARIRALGVASAPELEDVVRSMHWLRQHGNNAAHGFDITIGSEVAREGLRHCHDLARWLVGRLGYGSLEGFALDMGPGRYRQRKGQLRREEAQRRAIESLDRVTRQQKTGESRATADA